MRYLKKILYAVPAAPVRPRLRPRLRSRFRLRWRLRLPWRLRLRLRRGGGGGSGLQQQKQQHRPQRRQELLGLAQGLWLWFWLGLGLGLLPGCTSYSDAASSATVAQLTAQAAAWNKAIAAKDLVAIAANLCDEFRQIGGDGALEDREGFLRGVMSLDLQLEPYQVEDLEVRVYGDTALVTGRVRINGSYAGVPFTAHDRHTDVYVRVDGNWKVCSAQTTHMAQ